MNDGQPRYWKKRNDLIGDGTLTKDAEGRWSFTKDYSFDSPSEAACVIEGGSRDGLEVWQNNYGYLGELINKKPLE